MKQYFGKTSLLATALFTTSIIAPTSLLAQEVYDYPDEGTIVANCILSGTNQGGHVSDVTPMCVCVIEGLDDILSYEEYVKLEEKLQAGETPPESVTQIVDNCMDYTGG